MVKQKARADLIPSPSAPAKGRLSILVTLVLCLLTLTSLIPFGPHTVHASSSVNVITNPSFEQGLTGWGFETCEGVANATATVDNSRSTDGTQSAKVFTGPITPTGCIPGDNYTGRTVGFTQFRQFLPAGLTFNNLTNSPNGFSFSFQLQPYNNNGMAAFEVRIFGAESTAELDYVFDPSPFLGYENYTNPATGKDGLRSLLFYGYQPGQWYHFSRNLRADWENLGLNMTRSFSLVQFEGLAISNGGTVESETFWLDDVRAYEGTVHDIAVPSISAQPVSARVGTGINITVAVFNQGNVSESFGVSVYQNQTIIGPPRNILNLAPGSGTTFTLAWDTTGLAAGTYILKANATKVPGETYTANNVSPPTTVNLTANQPTSPMNFQVTATSESAILAWNPPRDNGGSPITEYKVYRGTLLSQLTILATIGNTTTYEDNAVTKGQTYYYKVTAVNGAGMESPLGNSAQRAVQIPPTISDAPSNLLLWLSITAAIIVAGVSVVTVIRKQAKTSPKHA